MSAAGAIDRRPTLSAGAWTLLAVTLMLSAAEANEGHVCRFDYDEQILAYGSPEEDEDALRATCVNPAMLRMSWRYQGAEGRYSRGVLNVHSPSDTLAFEGPVETEPGGRQALVISINANSALVRLIRRSDVEVRHRGGGYGLKADGTGCFEALLTACIFSRPAFQTTRAAPD